LNRQKRILAQRKSQMRPISREEKKHGSRHMKKLKRETKFRYQYKTTQQQFYDLLFREEPRERDIKSGECLSTGGKS